MKKRIISGRRAKQVRISSLLNGRLRVDSRYFDPLHKPFYALNVDSCPLTTGTPCGAQATIRARLECGLAKALARGERLSVTTEGVY